MEKRKKPLAGKNKTAGKVANKLIEKQTIWALVTMGALLLIFLFFFSVFSESRKFDYQGLTFTKEKYGEIPVYRYYYYFTDNSGQMIKYNVYLRNDPRENNIPVTGKIVFNVSKSVYFSINDTGLKECENAVIGVADLTKFLVDNQFQFKAGTPDSTEAKEMNRTKITCEIYPSISVIELRNGNTTQIVKTNNCYKIDVANCEVLEALEKFKVQSLIDAKEYGFNY